MAISGLSWARGGSDYRLRQAQHLLLGPASVSILGYEHDLAEEPALVLWNAGATEFSA
jgi:hypothetical protein